MEDRELLERAAKAAGIAGEWDEYWGFKRYVHDPDAYSHEKPWATWKPLTDDGDALRLAVVRKILRCHMDLFHKFYEEEIANGLKEDAATRRAIVRAVATLGECAKPPSPN
jgi:hypothetical protein